MTMQKKKSNSVLCSLQSGIGYKILSAFKHDLEILFKNIPAIYARRRR